MSEILLTATLSIAAARIGKWSSFAVVVLIVVAAGREGAGAGEEIKRDRILREPSRAALLKKGVVGNQSGGRGERKSRRWSF